MYLNNYICNIVNTENDFILIKNIKIMKKGILLVMFALLSLAGFSQVSGMLKSV